MRPGSALDIRQQSWDSDPISDSGCSQNMNESADGNPNTWYITYRSKSLPYKPITLLRLNIVTQGSSGVVMTVRTTSLVEVPVLIPLPAHSFGTQKSPTGEYGKIGMADGTSNL